MAYNLGSVGTAYDLGYTGTYTGGGITYSYVLTSHGDAHPNSIMANANFATTGTVELAVISDTDQAKVQIDWQAISDGQLWRQDVNTLDAVTVTASGDTTTTFTLAWRTPNSSTGQFTGTLNIDGTGAITLSVDVPTADSYTPGDTLSFTPNWNETVNVTGTPAINFTIGGSARQANYASGDGTAETVFSYTVQSGDEGAVSVGTLTLDGGTIKDAAGNDADLTLNSIGDTSGVLVDGVSPAITINALTTLDTTPIASGSAGDASAITLQVEGVDVTHGSSYTPTLSNGAWTQQLNELALGTYTMTATGVDDAGNESVVTATLKVVDEIITSPRGLFQPLFRSLTGSVNQTLFR
ncbi:Ig-like domain-containing protein [Marinobacter sp.]|uniref:Ig-like domain-containing protein n=1 Tax=Marinobacter sp. TaxID=50741 RepID=UPI00356415DB